MQFRSIALVATVALSTFAEASPPRKHLELRELQTREPKDGRKTAIAGALGALVGLVGMPLTFMFHTANHNPGAKAVAPEPPKAADPAASTACLNPKVAPVAVTTRDLETVAAPPAIGGTTAKLYGVGAGLGLLGAAVGSALPFVFTRPGPKPVPAPAPAPAEVNGTTDCSPKPKAPSAPLVARALNKEKLGAGAAGVGLITAIASSIFPFIFTRPGPKPKSIESLDNSNSSLATDEATFTLSAFRNNVSIAETVSFPHTLNLGVPATLALDCGNIAVTLRQFEAFTCDFKLPSNMPNATLTGENPGQSLSFEVAGDCVGVEFKVTNDCADCPTPLNVDCQGNVDGTDNEVALCATGSTLAKC
ncbi:hypothetical protein HYALB_00004992 [Hymenoscyphus albidus]|uniref:Uncharacterized protein n=1 Tax=Hymenoscyphus albidus TaxID=595503 RepID=A0A9N9LW54_9HELO|nr:hypothetical protein HYALB_00004992 [Hymenoscyphus albidus]